MEILSSIAFCRLRVLVFENRQINLSFELCAWKRMQEGFVCRQSLPEICQFNAKRQKAGGKKEVAAHTEMNCAKLFKVVFLFWRDRIIQSSKTRWVCPRTYLSLTFLLARLALPLWGSDSVSRQCAHCRHYAARQEAIWPMPWP